MCHVLVIEPAELSNERERFAVVGIVGLVGGSKTCRLLKRSGRAIATVHSQSEGVVWVRFCRWRVSPYDHLAGHGRGFVWSCGGFVEFDASFVFIRFDGEAME